MGSLLEAMGTHSREIEKHLGSYVRYDDHAFVALNTAFFQDGAFISIPERATVDKPILLLFINTASDGVAPSHPRNLILAQPNSKATIIERYVTMGNAPCFTNPVTEIQARKSNI
jgi:Fe-S cluster assembly protein SufD